MSSELEQVVGGVNKVMASGVDQYFAESDMHFLFVLIAVSITTFYFFSPTYFARKNLSGYGLLTLIRVLESNESRLARLALISKYDERFEEEKELNLQKSSQQVRKDLLLIQSMIDTKIFSEKIFQRLYSDSMVMIILCYMSFMKEFYPDVEIEKQIQKLYKNSYRWEKSQSKFKIKKHFESLHLELKDNLGL